MERRAKIGRIWIAGSFWMKSRLFALLLEHGRRDHFGVTEIAPG